MGEYSTPVLSPDTCDVISVVILALTCILYIHDTGNTHIIYKSLNYEAHNIPGYYIGGYMNLAQPGYITRTSPDLGPTGI